LDVEGLDTVIAPFEPGFSMPPAPALRQGTVIFSSTKLSAQPSCPALAENKHQGDASDDNHPECDE
jgi:hypothetical protein